MPNIQLAKKKDLSPFRKIALGTWQDAYDPSIYGSMRLRMDLAMKYIEDFRRVKGKKITVTHLFAKALASALEACPDANAIVRWNRIYLRQSVDLSIIVLIASGEDTGKVDLSAAKVVGVEKLSVEQIHDKLQEHVERVRQKKDPELEKTRQSMRWIPFLLMNLFLKFLSFLLYTFNLDLRWAGLPRDPFGVALISNIGSLGLDLAYVPLLPYTRVPILAAIGVVKDEPVVDEGKIAIGKVMDIGATFDHRVIDGAHAAVLARTVRRMFADPYGSFDRLEGIEVPAKASPEAPTERGKVG
jgi:pyruvate dehydrogenase E2 component (dihydrolipoamide acetyltransferase)